MGADLRALRGDRKQEVCPRCRGCGQLADTEMQEPWSDWTNRSLLTSSAVLAGIVRPHACPQCGGAGLVDVMPIDD